MEIFHLVHAHKLRQLALKCFPKFKRQFPRLTDKQGRCNKVLFLGYLNKRLDDHVQDAGPEFVEQDWVDETERRTKKEELKYLRTP